MFDDIIALLVGDLVVCPELVVTIRLMTVYLILKSMVDLIATMIRGSRFGN